MVSKESRCHPAVSSRERGRELSSCEQNFLALLLGRAEEVDAAIDAPQGGYSKCGERLHLCAEVKEGTGDIEAHQDQIRDEAKARNEGVLEEAVVGTAMIRDHAEEAAERVKDEGAEVRCESNGEQGIGKGGHGVVRHVAEVGEDVVRQCGDSCVA